MKPIAIFYHCLFVHGDPPQFKSGAYNIVSDQMKVIKDSGLLEAANHFLIGINGGEESKQYAERLLPQKAIKVYHGLQSKAENLTIVEMEKWLKDHPGWYVLYLHAKGCTHNQSTDYAKFSARWRNCMMKHCVRNWRVCVKDMDSGLESVGCHWMTGLGSDHSQNIWAGTFFWATSDFLRILPSIYERARIKMSGIAAAESRYEAEVWIGNGPRLPKVKDYHPNGLGTCP